MTAALGIKPRRPRTQTLRHGPHITLQIQIDRDSLYLEVSYLETACCAAMSGFPAIHVMSVHRVPCCTGVTQ
jgi:hypothetical protein